MPHKNLLAIYLRDHHAAAIAETEVAKRSANSNQGTAFAGLLEELQREALEDLRSLDEIMQRLGIQSAKGKDGAAWVAEKLGRLKLNGSVTAYSPLSRVVELEGISIAVESKKAMWRSLQQLEDDRLQRSELERLEARAADQQRRLEAARLEAVRIAFTAGVAT